MANKIQIKRGLKANLPTLSVGELAYCTDTKELFIGTGIPETPNLLINDLSEYYDKDEIQALAGDGLSWDAENEQFIVNDIFDPEGNYEHLRAQATTKEDIGLENVTNDAQVTSVTASSPLSATEGVTPQISVEAGYQIPTTEEMSDFAAAYTHVSSTDNPHAVTAEQVGLENVTNESKTTMFTDPTFTGVVTVPTPTASTSAATKAYVDEAAEGLRTRPSVRAATTTNLAADYYNGPDDDGIGATLTADTNRAFGTLDGVTGWAITSPRQGVLVKNQTNAAHNGRYILDVLGETDVSKWVLKRCSLCDASDEIPGSYTFVLDGTVNEGTGWVQIVDDPSTFVVGTDAINVFQFSGAGTYTAGTGLTLTGTAFAIDNTVLTTTNLLTAGDELTGAVKYNALNAANGQFYGGTTDPSATTRLNYSGNLHTTNLNVVTLATVGRLSVTNTSRTAGHLYAGSTDPVSTNRLNYDGYFYATQFFGGLDYTTTAPTANNTEGVKIAILATEPGTKYTGWLYFIQG
jgi:hypothetical protein